MSPLNKNVQYVLDGKPVSKSRNLLREIAWFHSAGIGGDDVKRVPLREFRTLLAGLGVSDPEVPGWEVTLPNGKTLAAIPANGSDEERQAARDRAAGSTDAPDPSPKPKDVGKPAPKKAPAKSTKATKKTPGAKARATKKAPAKASTKKAPARRTRKAPAAKSSKQVTTNFKQGA